MSDPVELFLSQRLAVGGVASWYDWCQLRGPSLDEDRETFCGLCWKTLEALPKAADLHHPRGAATVSRVRLADWETAASGPRSFRCQDNDKYECGARLCQRCHDTHGYCAFDLGGRDGRLLLGRRR